MEEELKNWLNRKDKTFAENLSFACKAWKSNVELHLQSKFEIITKWFCKALKTSIEKDDVVNWEIIEEFLQLHYPAAGLIPSEIKKDLIKVLIDVVDCSKKLNDRKPLEILIIACNQTGLQSYFKLCYEDYSELLKTIFMKYNLYIQNTKDLVVSRERECFDQVLSNIKEFGKQVSNKKLFKIEFTKTTLQPMVECYIRLKSVKINCFDDLLKINQLLFFEDDGSSYLEKVYDHLKIHIILQNCEFELAHFRSQTEFVKRFLKFTFNSIPKTCSDDPMLMLTSISYILGILRKYDIQLDVQITSDIDGNKFIHDHIDKMVTQYHENYLNGVLQVLCSTIKLNPIILEKNVIKISSICMLARKSEKDWSAFEEFLLLVMDMFRKLSRTEKLINQLLGLIKDQLKVIKLSKKLKRKLNTEYVESSPKKKKRYEDDEQLETTVSEKADSLELNDYLVILLQDLSSQNEAVKPKYNNDCDISSWKNISFAWPPQSVGIAFSKLISSLVSKPSLVIWKTLIFFLSESIECLKSEKLEENSIFLIELSSLLLCEYFAGSRLSDHADKFWKEIEKNRQLTRDMLKEFGVSLLNIEHNKRTMNAFLEVCYYAGNFDLIFLYYCPDSLLSESIIDVNQMAKNIHDYLNNNEWTLIEQRIVNFGKIECKNNMNRLHLQKIKSNLLFNSVDGNKNSKQILLSSALSDYDQMKAIFSDKSNLWILEHLTKKQKLKVCNLLLEDTRLITQEFVRLFVENHEFLEIIILTLYRKISECFDSKKSLIKSLDFELILHKNGEEVLEHLLNKISQKTEEYTLKKVNTDDIDYILKILTSLPLGFCKESTKVIIFAINLALYRDLLAAKNEAVALVCFDLFASLLHFGQPIDIFQHFEIDKLLAIFPPSLSGEFYEFLFTSVKHVNDEIEKCFKKIIEILQSESPKLNSDLVKLSIIIIDCFTNHNALKKLKKYHNEIVSILVAHINYYFANDDRNKDQDKDFVERTLPAFTVHLSSKLGDVKNVGNVEEQFRKISKIYIGLSINFHNPYAIKLLNTALINREILHFYPNEVQFVLQKYWDDFVELVKNENNQFLDTDSILKTLIDYKSEKEFRKTLMDIEKNLPTSNVIFVCRTLSRVARLNLHTNKRRILNELFKSIMIKIVINLKKDNNRQFTENDIILNILQCQRTICENKLIPMSVDTIDDILTFMMDINIKKLNVDETNVKYFNTLHKSITDVCFALIKFRHTIVTDRIPHFVQIFKDLAQSLCWYRSDRKIDENLDTAEIEELAELAHKLENLMHNLASHSLDVKRLAPYLLVYTIGLMVTNKRPTTLYPKIKLHIENICYDLISICDHRVGTFILRSSNDATRHAYETLRKDFKKYHKFKGKV